MAMSQKQIAKWEITRQMGRRRYIWLYGVLGWGIATGVIWAVIMAAMQGWERLPLLLAVALVGFPIGGYFFGLSVWKLAEKQYQQAMANKDRC